MIRMAIMLSDSLHQRLRMASRAEHKKMMVLVPELLEIALHQREEKRRQSMYDVLKEMDGIGAPSIRDASTTIDQVLYGEQK